MIIKSHNIPDKVQIKKGWRILKETSRFIMMCIFYWIIRYFLMKLNLLQVCLWRTYYKLSKSWTKQFRDGTCIRLVSCLLISHLNLTTKFSHLVSGPVYTGIIQTSLVFLGAKILSNPLNRNLNVFTILNLAINIEYQYKIFGLGIRIFDMKYGTK